MYSKNSSFSKIVLFLISPLLSFIYSLKDLKSKSSQNIIFIFIMFFGFSMCYDGTLRNDGLFHAYDFQCFTNETFESYSKMIQSFFSVENPEQIKDIYGISVEYLVSRVTDNYHYFFGALSILFGIFTVKNIRVFASLNKFTFSLPLIVLLYIFWTPQPVAINGVRYGTAMVIMIYCFFQIFLFGNNRYVLLVAFLPLIHASFVFAWALLVLSYFTRKFETIWFVLMILSFAFSEVSMQILKDNVYLIESAFWSDWVDNYIHYEDTYAVQGSGFYWITPIFKTLSRSFIFGMMVITYSQRHLIRDTSTSNLFKATIVWYTVSNFVYAIPSLGERFILLSYPMIAYIWTLYFVNSKYKTYLYLYPVANLLALKTTFDIYSGLLEPSFLITPIYNFVKYTLYYTPVTLPTLF